MAHVRTLCPLSTVMLGTQKVDPHYSLATLCKNGTIHIYCVLHGFKGFISHPTILEKLNGKTQPPQQVPDRT